MQQECVSASLGTQELLVEGKTKNNGQKEPIMILPVRYKSAKTIKS